MNDKGSLLHDLNDLARLQPDTELAKQAVERASAIVASSSAHIPKVPLRLGAQLMRPRNLIAAAAAAAAILLLAQLLPSNSGGNIAFAQVQAEVAKTKSVTYVQTMTCPDLKDKQVWHVSILGNDFRRTDATFDPPVLSPAPNVTPVTRMTAISNAKTHESISLYPERKEFLLLRDVDFTRSSEFSMPHPPSDDDLSRPHSTKLSGNFYDSFLRVSSDKAKPLPERTIDGKRAVGFLVEKTDQQPSGGATWRLTYWVDAATKLPIRIETSYRSTLSPKDWADEDSVVSDIVFDAPSDPALFSTDPPKGWTAMAPQ